MTAQPPRLTSPQKLAKQLAKQWQRADVREARLLAIENTDAPIYPLRLPIPMPSAKLFDDNLTAVKAHLAAWKNIKIGEVHWQEKSYRALQKPLEIPRVWQLHNNEEWIAATGDIEITREYRRHLVLFDSVSSQFHRVLLRNKNMIMERDTKTVILACQLAEQLNPNIANGVPLRALSLAGIDSKFFENHRQLIIKLLDCRFNGAASRLGLENFLGACKDEHWLLVVDLDGNLLPFQQQKIRSSELQQCELPPCHLLVCENIQVAHALPQLPKTLAILGAGLDLAWLQAKWTINRKITYWGDIDTWGLAMLARARSYCPHIRSVLMNDKLFEQYANKAVAETTHADTYIADIFHYLNEAEQQLYQQLKNTTLGRLEQEFIEQADILGALSISG